VKRPRLRYGLLGLGTLAYTSLMLVWFSVAAYLAEIVTELGLTSTQAGLLTGAVPLTYVPVALFSGVVTDRIGPYRAIGIGLVLFGAAQVGRASAESFGVLLALTVVVGIGGTTITFGLPKLVAELFPTDASGTPSSIYMLGSFAGTAAAFSLGRGVVGPMLGGWRPLFWAIGVGVLAYAALWWLVVYVTPLSALRIPDDPAEDPDASADGGVRGVTGLKRDVGRVFRTPAMRWLVVVGVVYLMIVHGLQNWLATVLQARGVTATLAASITSAFVVAEAAGTLTMPAVSDRFGRRGGVIAVCGAACALGTATLLVPGVPFVLPVIGALVVGVGVGGISPLVRMVPPELEGVGPALTGTAVGLVFAVGELGGFLGPFLVGALFDVTGSYAPGLAVIGLGCLAAVVAGWRIPA
jgi:cyanate permease